MVLQAAQQRERAFARRGQAEGVRAPAADDDGGRKTETARGRHIRGGDARVGKFEYELDVYWADTNVGEHLRSGHGANHDDCGGSKRQHREYGPYWRSARRNLAHDGWRDDMDGDGR